MNRMFLLQWGHDKLNTAREKDQKTAFVASQSLTIVISSLNLKHEHTYYMPHFELMLQTKKPFKSMSVNFSSFATGRDGILQSLFSFLLKGYLNLVSFIIGRASLYVTCLSLPKKRMYINGITWSSLSCLSIEQPRLKISSLVFPRE